MQRLIILLGFVIVNQVTFGQKYSAIKGTVVFFSDALIEDISASNNKVRSLFDSSTGEIAFSVPIKEFQFQKKLMQEHFNEKYMESDKFPQATFMGKVLGFDKDRKGSQTVKARGKLMIHGITKEVLIEGTIENFLDKFLLKTVFPVKLKDYSITIPQLLWQNIAEEVKVTVEVNYKIN